VGNTTLGTFAYQLSPTGRRLQVTEADGAVESYAYDALERLLGDVRTGSAPRSVTYEYDKVGNRTRMVRNGTPTAYAYDVNDRLLAAGATTYTYDENGNQRSRTEGGATTTYRWDFENRLVGVAGPAGTVELDYDADGNLVARRRGGQVARFLVDEQNPTGFAQVLEERDGLDVVRRHYTYGAAPLSQTADGTTAFYLADGLGSVRLLTGNGGVVTDRYGYDAYGALATSSGATSNPYRYRGERLDETTGLYHLRARWMDPALGRFISRDPFPGFANDPSSLHKYLYASDDPVNRLDPSGLYTLIEAQQVVSLIHNLNSLAQPILRAYDTASMIADVLTAVYTIGNLLNGIPGGAAGPTFPGELRDALDRKLMPGPDEAALVISGNLPRVLGTASGPWITFLVAGFHRIEEFSIYAPNVVPLPLGGQVGVSLGTLRLGKARIPVRLVLGGRDSGRLFGTGIGVSSTGGGPFERKQIWRVEFHPLHTLGFALPRRTPRNALDHWTPDGEPEYTFYVNRP
jgi:RHS repeat-associated protein